MTGRPIIGRHIAVSRQVDSEFTMPMLRFLNVCLVTSFDHTDCAADEDKLLGAALNSEVMHSQNDFPASHRVSINCFACVNYYCRKTLVSISLKFIQNASLSFDQGLIRLRRC